MQRFIQGFNTIYEEIRIATYLYTWVQTFNAEDDIDHNDFIISIETNVAQFGKITSKFTTSKLQYKLRIKFLIVPDSANLK